MKNESPLTPASERPLTRRVALRGFAIQIEVPAKVARLRSSLLRALRAVLPVRRVRPHVPVPDGVVALRDPPVVQVVARDPQRALDFLRDPALQGDGSPSPQLLAYLEEVELRRSAASTLAEKVAATPWYHTIDLGYGLLTPGTHDHRPLVGRLGLPDDLRGARCLDVATFDGFWAFELEHRGGDVTAVDLPSTAGLDLPTGARRLLIAEGLDVPFGYSFGVARDALGSSVKREPRNVYDLVPDDLGTFDLVFAGDLLLHLEHPLDALRRIRSVTRGKLILVDRYAPELTGVPGRLIGYEGGWNGLEWWRPSLDALAQMVVDAGFADVTVSGTYQLATTLPGHGAGWDRAIIHATP